jgi:hypothetical protein
VYRDSEVAALADRAIEAARNGERAAALAAARTLWLAADELAPGAPDHWENQAWHALAKAGLLFDAVGAGVELIREGRRLRLGAFVHVVQHVGGALVVQDDQELRRTTPREITAAESALLHEILAAVRKGAYPDDGYSAAVFMRFLEGQGKRFVWPYLEEHEAELGKSRDGWQMLGLIKFAFGAPDELAAWWGRWPEYQGVEMWTAMMHLAALRDRFGRGELEALATHSQAALDRLAPDESAHLVCCVQLESLLRLGRSEAFEAGLERHAALLRLGETSNRSMCWRPILRFLNRFKDQWRLGGSHLYDGSMSGEELAVRVTLGPLFGIAMDGPPTLDKRIGELCHELQSYDLAAPRAFALFRDLGRTDDHKAVLELCRQFRPLKGETWMVPMRTQWLAMLPQKLGWRSRLYAKLYY